MAFMSWEESQRIQREVVAPRFDNWLCDTSKVERQDILEAVGIKSIASNKNDVIEALLSFPNRGRIATGVTGPVGNKFGPNQLRDLVVLMMMKDAGIPIDQHQRINNFLVNNDKLLEALMTLGPRDDFAGNGPGKPLVVSRDTQGRLHCEDGPAMIFSDFDNLYALSGVHIPESVWDIRKDAKAILKIDNVEQKRAMMQLFGLRKFINESGLQPVHHDRYGALYYVHTGVERWNPIDAYVHVTCPSTKQDYVLAVPSQCETAHEAVAWTFGMVPEDYDPQKET